MNIVIPMAGAGSRFQEAGYTFPKPLIEVNGQPMIQTVVSNLNINGTYIFLVQKSHYEKLLRDHQEGGVAEKRRPSSSSSNDDSKGK